MELWLFTGNPLRKRLVNRHSHANAAPEGSKLRSHPFACVCVCVRVCLFVIVLFVCVFWGEPLFRGGGVYLKGIQTELPNISKFRVD